MNQTHDPLLEVSVIARQMGVSQTAVRNWIRMGRLRAVRTPTGRYRVRQSELDRISDSPPPDSQPADK